MPPYDERERTEHQYVCEQCGRAGYEWPTELLANEVECMACVELRRRVARREAEWILWKAMVKLGRLPDPFAPAIASR